MKIIVKYSKATVVYKDGGELRIIKTDLPLRLKRRGRSAYPDIEDALLIANIKTVDWDDEVMVFSTEVSEIDILQRRISMEV